MATTLTFLGASGTVTGSKTLVRSGGRALLVDCGLFQGAKELRLRNWAQPPFDAAALDAVALTHAHVDHSGALPLLAKNGFAGPIYSSPATRDLCGVLLRDAARLQEEEAAHANRHRYSKHAPALPLFTQDDAERALALFRPVAFEERVELGEGVSLELARGGHMLGGSIVGVATPAGSIVFTGDLGRPDDELLLPPADPKRAEWLVLESTYGDRLHLAGDPTAGLGEAVRRTAARGGAVIIPSFCVGRAQSVLHSLAKLRAAKALPDVPVFLNSPMAAEALRLYSAHASELRLPAAELRALGEVARVITSVEESKRLNDRRGPMVVLAGSGMATGGRVLHHLRAFAPDARNTLLFVGFQAAQTRGAAIVAGAKAVKMLGEQIPIRAEVVQLDGFSGHCDQAQLLRWLDRFEAPPRLTFVNHGEPLASQALRAKLEERKGWRCRVPAQGDAADLTPDSASASATA